MVVITIITVTCVVVAALATVADHNWIVAKFSRYFNGTVMVSMHIKRNSNCIYLAPE